MKKLLLFIIVLFGSMSAMSLADGCMAQVCTCSNGGYVSYGEYCAVYNNTNEPNRPSIKWYAFAYDKSKNLYGVGSGNDKKSAQNEALKNCNTEDCKIIKAQKTPGQTVLIALSSNGILLTSSPKKKFSRQDISWEEYERTIDELIKNCKDKGGINCKLVFDTDSLRRGW